MVSGRVNERLVERDIIVRQSCIFAGMQNRVIFIRKPSEYPHINGLEFTHTALMR